MLIGVFNTGRSVELVLKGLAVLEAWEATGFWIGTDNGEYFATELQTLRQKVTAQASNNCIGCCCSCKPVRSTKQRESRFVADAELYNVDALRERYHAVSEKSPEVLFELIDPCFLERAPNLKEVRIVLDEIDGAYAFAYWRREATNGDELYLARDILGLRPLCFAHADGFAFASDKRALEAMGFRHAIELDPRSLLRYSIEEDRLQFVKRAFFSIAPELAETKEKIKEKLLTLLRASIQRRLPGGEKFGVLFSGGLDSTLIAYLCRELDADFVCYTVAVDDPGMKEAEDLSYATRIAADLGLPVRVKRIGVDDVERYLKEVVPLIDDTDGVKISVAVPLYAACEMAKENGVTVVFSGLGTEELFAGYERHKRVNNREAVNRECLAGLLGMHERDLYRDYMVAKAHGISLRTPFLAPDPVAYALRIPAEYKLAGDTDKAILREVARDLGLKDAAGRKKRAVQYGANVVKAIEKLAKRNGYRYTRDYLRTFLPSRNIKLGALFSSGKDSTFALWLMRKAGYPVECLITVKSRNPESYMFHTPAVELTELQAKAMGLPLVLRETAGEKEKELEDLRAALRATKLKYGIEGVITGALWSTYQKERIERIAREEDLAVFSPLWHSNQETEMRLAVSHFTVILTGVSAYGLDKRWLGRRITLDDVDCLVALSKKLLARRDDRISLQFGGLNIAGEGGEFESLVLDGPVFKQRLVVEESEIVEEDAHTARLVVRAAKLVEKSTRAVRDNSYNRRAGG
jgi:asparagine synthase (glutamine-hydrolysing)